MVRRHRICLPLPIITSITDEHTSKAVEGRELRDLPEAALGGSPVLHRRNRCGLVHPAWLKTPILLSRTEYPAVTNASPCWADPTCSPGIMEHQMECRC